MAGKLAEPGPSGNASEIEPAPQAQTALDGQRAAERGAAAERGDELGAAAAPADERGDEHIGPVTIARYVKDDGRALIVYTREPPSPT